MYMYILTDSILCVSKDMLSSHASTSEFSEQRPIMVFPTVYVSQEFSYVDVEPLSSLQVELRGRYICTTLT